MTIDFQRKDCCCGCTSCVLSCPQDALSMQEDTNGFMYPVVNKEKCISCGLCDRVCDFNSEKHYSHGDGPIAAYAIKHINEDIRAVSRSGGVFTAITDYIIDNNGCVYGAALDDNFLVRHIKCETKEQRDKLHGSKYVQSNLGSVYQDVKCELDKGRMVGFSGTACQVAGLYAFLRCDYQNLITFDLLCHGVPSPKLWKDYIKYIKAQYGGDIQEVNFRDKQLMGWDVHIESYVVNKHKIYSRNYTKLFLNNLSLRRACFFCKYTNLQRPGDFTLADFWGIEKMLPGFNDNKGVSLLLINSLKAEEIFKANSIQTGIEKRKCTNFEFVHPNFKRPADKPDCYDTFWEEYNAKGIEYIIKKYSYIDLKSHLCSILIYIKAYIKRVILNDVPGEE